MYTKPVVSLATSILISLCGQAQTEQSESEKPLKNGENYRIERVIIKSANDSLVGHLYIPSTPPPHPALIITGAWRTVKEQMPAGYAREMAARGYAALIFDFRGWGESTGKPKRMENPLDKADDIVAAAAYLATRSDIIKDKVFGLGICASAGYMATAATRTDLIKAVALAAPALPNRATVVKTLGGEKGVQALRKQAEEAAIEYKSTGKEKLIPAVAATPQNTIAGADYYTNPKRGNIPEWDNTFNPASWINWLDYDAQSSATQLKQPLFIIHSNAAASPESVREYIAKVPAPVEQVWLDGVTQFDFYDQPAAVKAVSDAVAKFFSATLSDK